MRIVFERNSKVFTSLMCKNLTHMAMKFSVYVLMLLAIVDLSFKYSFGCNKDKVFSCCLIRN